jgi:F-type H+-transporting ATPase subunit b
LKKWPAFLFLAACLACAAPIHAETTSEQKEIAGGDPDLTLWRWANFAVLFGVIGYYAVKLGRPYFNRQTESINQGLEEARRRRAEAEQRSADVQQKLSHLGDEIESLRKTILEEQRLEAERMRERLRDELDRMNANTLQQIESLAKHERLALQRYASTLALELAERRVRFIMNPELQDSLSGQFVESLRVGA